MLNKLKSKILKNPEIIALSGLIIITIISTSYYNFNKSRIYENYKQTINNVYLKKTANHIFNNLEPKFKKIQHKVSPGETFASILESYSVKKNDISEIRKKISKRTNLNKLNTNQKFEFTLNQKNNSIVDFLFQISNKENIYLTKNDNETKFTQKILITQLKKQIVYNENVILESLYRSASKKKVPASIIIEFARIYGFEVDFQRDIRKKDSFQIMYEIFTNDKGKIIETGNVLYSNLKLSGENLSLY